MSHFGVDSEGISFLHPLACQDRPGPGAMEQNATGSAVEEKQREDCL